jgi:ornithine carbamoyltransferase
MSDVTMTRCLAQMAREFRGPPELMTVCFVGDGEHPIAGSLLTTGALLGMDVRVATPLDRWPSTRITTTAEGLAAFTGARLLVTSDVGRALAGADFVCTDEPFTEAESDAAWSARTRLPARYRVTASSTSAAGRPPVQVVVCRVSRSDCAFTSGPPRAADVGVLVD